MKNIKLLLALMAGLFVANAAFALDLTGATARSAYVSGSNAGTGLLNVAGTNGHFYTDTYGGSGDVSPVTSVENVNTVVCIALSAYAPAIHSAGLYVVIPSGCTGAVTYYVVNTQGGTAYVTIGSTTYTNSGSLTLSPGTYYLYSYASLLPPATSGNSQATIDLTITLD
jgi:hypothetical protein